MRRLRIFRNLHTALLLVVVCGVVAGGLGLWWANRTGMPDEWRAAIEQQMGRQGARVKIGALSYEPWRGVVAREVRVFADDACEREIARVERVVVQLDKTKLARGILRVSKVALEKARVRLMVNPEDPESDSLEVSDVSGMVLMPGGRRLEVRDGRGTVAGVEVEFRARMLGFSGGGSGKRKDPERGRRQELIGVVAREMARWRFDETVPPVLRVFVEGDLTDRSSLVARMTLQARGVERNGHALDEVSASGELNGHLLTVTALRATDARGVLEGRVDYDLHGRDGRFDGVSSVDMPKLLKVWFGMPDLKMVVFGGGQRLEAAGDYQLPEDGPPVVRLTGRARCESVMLRGVPFDSVESDFSWDGASFYLRDLVLRRQDGVASGKAMVEWPQVRVALHTTLPVAVYRPFFVGQPLELVLKDFADRDGAKVDVHLEGSFDLKDRYAWAYAGSGRVEKTRYKGVPVESAEASFSLSHHELDFYRGTVVFDYRDYGLRKAYQGPRTGTAKVGRIRFVAAQKMVDVEGVEGEFWAAPMVRLFAPPVADALEIYKFHRPPQLSASGRVDVTPGGRTALDVRFSTPSPAAYRFLDEELTLLAPRGRVRVAGPRVTVKDLMFDVFGGPVVAQLVHDGKGLLEGEMSWNRLEIPLIGEAYDFEMKGGGLLTGRVEFAMRDDQVATMNGKGHLGLEKAELFSVPIFGPLSPLISGVLGNRRAGFEQAKDGFLSFEIQDGILSSKDFQTATPSLVFTGDGVVELEKRDIEMTIRMNARGLFGVITLPLRPFYGLFQFRGKGPLGNPEWENVMFTSPPPGQSDALLNPPKAVRVAEP